jgi:predicted porin
VTSKTQVTSSLTKLAPACALSRTHILSLTLGTVVAGSLTAAAPARAETIDELLDLLKAKGAITEPEYDRLKARHHAEAKGGEERLRAAEARAREAEANAREAEAKALRTARSVPPMVAKAPVPYLTALPNCVGFRAGKVDVCVKGDIIFFGIEQFTDKNGTPPPINGGLATASQKDSNSIRGGLLPSSIQVSINTQQSGIDVGAYFGAYIGGNNINWGTFGANNGGSPVGLGTAGIDFRQVYGTLGTPTVGTVKAGRDLGMFASDAILNDDTLFGVGTPAANFAPTNTTLGRIGIGYIYADWIPQISYKSPSFNGFTVSGGLFTPLDEVPFSGDPQSGTMTGHAVPSFQGQLKYVGTFAPDVKLTLSTSGVVQRQEADCKASIPTFGTSSCIGAAPLVSSPLMAPGTSVTAWAVDGFGRFDVYGLSLVGYGYTGQGVGTTALFFDGVDARGNTRRSFGGYGQASYTFYNVFTVGGSFGISVLDTANAVDAAAEFAQCIAATKCLVHKNESWIPFIRYKLTDWVKLQAEFVHTRAENQIGQTITDNAILAGTTFFW